jgi:polyphosphate kinase 2 (PPK2 family)
VPAILLVVQGTIGIFRQAAQPVAPDQGDRRFSVLCCRKLSEIPLNEPLVAGGLTKNDYHSELAKLQSELCHVQEWAALSRERAIIALEGRSGAGKGCIARALTAQANPDILYRVRLPKLTEREEARPFMQRCAPHFPAHGQIVVFSPSWYRQATAEFVLGLCTYEQHSLFLETCPLAEKYLVNAGIRLIKLWVEIGPESQERRLAARLEDPMHRWKVEESDLELYRRRYDLSKARDRIFEYTDTAYAPWYIVHMDDERRGTLNALQHIIAQFPYQAVERTYPKMPSQPEAHSYDDYASIANRRMVPEKY